MGSFRGKSFIILGGNHLSCMVSMEIMLVRGRGCHMSSTHVQGTSIFVHLLKAGKPVVGTQWTGRPDVLVLQLLWRPPQEDGRVHR